MQEVERIHAALQGLAGNPPPAVAEDGVRLPPPSYFADTPSARGLMKMLFDEGSQVDWSAPELITEGERRGIHLRATDPANAMRAALSEAFRSNEIIRTSYGRYRAAALEPKPTVAVTAEAERRLAEAFPGDDASAE